jgi:hypothetical protein
MPDVPPTRPHSQPSERDAPDSNGGPVRRHVRVSVDPAAYISRNLPPDTCDQRTGFAKQTTDGTSESQTPAAHRPSDSATVGDYGSDDTNDSNGGDHLPDFPNEAGRTSHQPTELPGRTNRAQLVPHVVHNHDQSVDDGPSVVASDYHYDVATEQGPTVLDHDQSVDDGPSVVASDYHYDVAAEQCPTVDGEQEPLETIHTESARPRSGPRTENNHKPAFDGDSAGSTASADEPNHSSRARYDQAARVEPIAENQYWNDLIRAEHREHDQRIRDALRNHFSGDPSDPDSWVDAVSRAKKAGDLRAGSDDDLEQFLRHFVMIFLQQLIMPGVVVPPTDLLSALLTAADLGRHAS